MTKATRSSAAPPLRQREGGHEQRDKQEHDLHRGEAVQQKDKRPHLPEPRLHDQDHHEDGTDELRYCISLGQHCAFLVQCMPPFMINAPSQGPQALVRPKREEGSGVAMAVELKKIPKAKGTAGQGPTLAELGAGKKDAARAQRLWALGAPN